ncbi:HdeD family acid-resistance protein [Lentzea tibetensis]|uniref:HdeD family acid-resistance protein n=1 Tax=Lentzea tibetensis TaxID=2591470 RepID=A0A563EHS9_9PSEU|nr:HdeD family acid-resistance protein [Lentzea tibetensis]TWP46230.1 HdeD family acid-resistance protein [Lentzea tibetensis]
MLLETLAQRWGLFALRGALAILFGVMALVWPGITLLALVLLWGAYALVDGVTALYMSFTQREWPTADRVMQGVFGAIGVIAGIGAIAWPGLTVGALLIVIAVWAIVAGVIQIAAAIRMRKVVTNEWFYVLTGVLSVVLGIILFASPGSGALALVVTIGVFAIMWGVVLLLFSFRLRSLTGHSAAGHGQAAPA